MTTRAALHVVRPGWFRAAGLLVFASLAAAQLAPIPPQPARPESAPAPATTPPATTPPATTPPATPATSPPPGPDFTSAENNALENELNAETEEATRKGLARLAAMQNEDRSFGESRWGRSVAITSLACLAFMADGNLPGRGPYGEAVERGLEFVLSNCAENGLVAAEAANGPMYGHGFATLFLGEIYGMTAPANPGTPEAQRADRVHEALVRAVRLIEATQNEEGGWRYNPVPYDADVSVTICEIMALRSARNAGIEVPKETIDRAVEYVRKCQNPDGGFKYQLQTGPSGWERSAAGIASLFYAGIYEDKAIVEGLDYLVDNGMPPLATRRAHYFYGHYYGVQAAYLAGGKYWKQWWPAVRTELLRSQNDQGGWNDQAVGEAYGTAMALIVLQMPKRYLPIFQK
jgi:hypothetical protein